jgi:DNA-binding CsgD family transcriptional regulator
MTPTPPPDIPTLTAQQREIVVLVLNDLTNREIADRLGLTPGVVGMRIGRILSRLGLHSRAELATLAMARIEPPDDQPPG